jgi:hypothetical protein
MLSVVINTYVDIFTVHARLLQILHGSSGVKTEKRKIKKKQHVRLAKKI